MNAEIAMSVEIINLYQTETLFFFLDKENSYKEYE